MVKSNLKEEERLSEEIQKFNCIYDKGDERYKEKHRKKKHGVKRENAFGYEEGT